MTEEEIGHSVAWLQSRVQPGILDLDGQMMMIDRRQVDLESESQANDI